jgi:16S rRNA (adenine1518-N6/adenine1519-N6)-dimethyltransferase
VARPKKRLGQHFLFDPGILGRIADALDVGAGDTVLEIGPGPGGLTGQLARRVGDGGRLVAIEKDADMLPRLRASYPSATLVEADALETDWHELSRGSAGRVLVTGNIPYNITSPLIDKALEPPMPARVVFLVQKEVADRVAAAPGSKAYGALSVGVQAVCRVERLFTVPAGAFHPPPKVDSAVLRLTPLEAPLVSEGARDSFRRMVVGLFGFRRKQLLRGLRELTGWPAERVQDVLAAAALRPDVRPEVLDPASFALLHVRLVDGGWRTG